MKKHQKNDSLRGSIRSMGPFALFVLTPALVLLMPALVWAGPQLDQLIDLSQDIATQSNDFYRATKTGAVPNPNRDRLVQAAFELASATAGLSQHLQGSTDAETINRDLGALDQARDSIERWLPVARPSQSLSVRWTQIRDRISTLFSVAGGESESAAPPPPPPPPQPPRGRPPVTRISLIGVPEIQYASQDLSAQLDHLLRVLDGYRREHGARATRDSLLALKSQADALASGADEDSRTQARSLGGYISGVDRTIAELPSYPHLRPLWVASRGLAMGIYTFAR